MLNAEFMANEVPGVRVPDAVLDRMRRVASPAAAAAEGVAIAREVGCALKGVVQGTHVAAPSGRVEAALEVLAAVQPLSDFREPLPFKLLYSAGTVR